jgi:predicted transcriptional regulator
MTTAKADSVLLTVKVSPDLKEAFNQAVRLNDRTASQVLRDFMRSYVEQSVVSSKGGEV